jgi:hypothetical protein
MDDDGRVRGDVIRNGKYHGNTMYLVTRFDVVTTGVCNDHSFSDPVRVQVVDRDRRGNIQWFATINVPPDCDYAEWRRIDTEVRLRNSDAKAFLDRRYPQWMDVTKYWY